MANRVAMATPEEVNRARAQAWYHANKARAKAARATWRTENREKKQTYDKAWRAANREQMNATAAANRRAKPEIYGPIKKRYQDKIIASGMCRSHPCVVAYRKRRCLNCTIGHNLRGRLRLALQRGTKTGSAVRDLGCTVAELRTWLEFQFAPGMTWENYGAWEIDHVRPLASFDLSDRSQLLQACHFMNLQPLWKQENLFKRAIWKEATA